MRNPEPVAYTQLERERSGEIMAEKNYLIQTPEGGRDIYGAECRRKLAVQEKILQVLYSYGYEHIQTPSFEYFDIFSKDRGSVGQRAVSYTHLLGQFERTGDIMSYQNNYEVEIVDSGEQVLLTCRATMSVEDFGRYYGKIYEQVAREHLEVNGVVLAIYHDKEFDPAFSLSLIHI